MNYIICTTVFKVISDCSAKLNFCQIIIMHSVTTAISFGLIGIVQQK